MNDSRYYDLNPAAALAKEMTMRTSTPSPVSTDGRRPARHELGTAPNLIAFTELDTDADSDYVDPQSVVAVQEQRYGGIKWGSAFFGWVTAVGAAVLLAIPVTAVGATVGLTENLSAQNPSTLRTVGIIAIVTSLTVAFAAHFCGGYVAGRMARFNGARQGLAVWMWAVAIAVFVAVGLTIADVELGVIDIRAALSQLPIKVSELSTRGTAAALLALAAMTVALGGAVLGGWAGMRFHRRIDRDGIEQWDRFDEEE